MQSVHLVANRGAGSGSAVALLSRIRQRCAALGRPLHEYIAERPRQLGRCLVQADRNAALQGGMLLVVGGDGTLRSAAQRLAGSDRVMAIIPAGTFNFFARNLGVPEDPEAALELALTGTPRAVDLGCVNDHVFLSNASFGLYARLIRAREQHSRRFGRHRLVAIASTVLTLLRGYRTMRLSVRENDQARQVRSPMVFVGINSLQLRGIDLDVADCIERGQLAVVVMKPVGGWALFRLSLRGLLRRLRDERSLELCCTPTLTIQPDRPRLTVVLDGERMRIAAPLAFSILPGALQVIAPAAVSKEDN